MPLSDISASVDLYGGGGLISNMEDLARFHRMAATGALFEDAALNAALITPSPQSLESGRARYGMGFFIREYAGETCYEHSGFWGTLAVYCPETDITVAAAVTDAEAGFAALGPLVEAIVIAAR
jgi:D-alanyl-D-alanine carboxypeptidase